MDQEPATVSGHRGLQLEEPLIFEQGAPEKTGVDVPESPLPAGGDRLRAHRRKRRRIKCAKERHDEQCGALGGERDEREDRHAVVPW